MKMNERVAQWANKNFSLSKPKSADLSAKAKRLDSEIIATVHEGSPAFFLGLKAGWILISINRKPYAYKVMSDIKFSSSKKGRHRFELYDPHTKLRYILKSKYWPFGLVLIPPPSKIADALKNGAGFSWDDVHSFWRYDLMAETAELYPALEAYCAKKVNRPRPETLPPKNEPYPNGIIVEALASVSLAAFAAGHTERAAYMHRMTEARLKGIGSVSSYTVSIHYYLGSLLSDLAGDHENAVKYARRAYQRAPDSLAVQNLLKKLIGETHVTTNSQWDRACPLNYELLNKDPVDEQASSGRVISFQKTLDQLEPDQLMLIFVMGHYRSNGYYLGDLVTATPILNTFKSKVGAVHVICEGDRDVNANNRKRFERLALRRNVPLQILFDENRTVSSLIRAKGFPARLFYNKAGEVLSEEKLWDETGIWEAFRKS